MKTFLKQVRIELALHMREPEAIFWGFIFPVLMVLAMGYLFSKSDSPTPKIQLGVNQNSFTDSLGQIALNRLQTVDGFYLRYADSDSLEIMVKNGAVAASLDLRNENGQAVFQVNYAALGAAQIRNTIALIEEYKANLNYAAFAAKNLEIPWQSNYTELKIEAESGSSINYATWLVPGVLALNLFLSCIFGIGIQVVMAKKQGKLKKIATTPLSKSRYISFIATQRMIILFLQAVVIAYAGYLFFNVGVAGSILELMLVLIVSMFAFMVFGFAVASVSNTIEKAVALSNLFFIVSLLASGAYFSNAGFPDFIKMFTDYLPATLSVDIIRGIYSYGKSMFEFPAQLVGLAAWLLISMLLSVKLFKWTEN
ncbi:MAG: ABC transporter permease [Calditrichaeota bacterium]|nr:ABC transporter permease [Calditrichota bacterium]